MAAVARPMEGPWVRVWPAWQRLLHAVLAASVLAALATYDGGAWHEAAGYTAGAAALLRIGLGFWGPGVARFTRFVRGPRAVWAYARALRDGVAERHLNHNPVGGWMVVTLLGVVTLAAAAGALFVTDRFWGDATVIAAHAALAWPLAGLVPLHLAGVLLSSRLHHENLAAAMVHGRKRA